MIYIIIYQNSNGVNIEPKFIIVDQEKDLAFTIDKIKSNGQNPTILLYKADQVNYKLTYNEKDKIVKEKIPVIGIIS